jgi:hypothetical protein
MTTKRDALLPTQWDKPVAPKPVTQITSLTDEQKAQMQPWVDKWIAIGLSCAPADRATAEQAYRACYVAARLDPQVPILWVQSPIVGAFAASIADAIMSDEPKGKKRVPAGKADESKLRAIIERVVNKSVAPAAQAAIANAVFSTVMGLLPPNTIVPDTISTKWHYWLGGQFWSAWSAYESFFREVCGLVLRDNLNERAANYALTCKSAGYWWPNKHFIIACERPSFIKQDREGRLHSEQGHSIEWRDSWGITCWHGVTIPDAWLTPGGRPTAAQALQQSNIEQRRAACEILGWKHILAALKSQTIDKDEDPQIGELVEVDLPGSGKERFLRVLCGTGREFALPVPAAMKTALEANAWTYMVEPSVIKMLEKRT